MICSKIRLAFGGSVAAALVILAALGSCFSPYSGGDGNLVIQFSGAMYGIGATASSRAIGWDPAFVAGLTHTVTVSNGSGETMRESGVQTGGRVSFAVPEGTWTVTVEGFSGTTRTTQGSTAVSVTNGAVTRAAIKMFPVETGLAEAAITLIRNTEESLTVNTLYLAGEGEATITWPDETTSTHVLHGLPSDPVRIKTDPDYRVSSYRCGPGDDEGVIRIEGKISGISLSDNDGIRSFDVGNAGSLRFIECLDTDIEDLSVGNALSLTYLDCSDNENLEIIYYTSTSALAYIDCHSCGLTAASVNNMFDNLPDRTDTDTGTIRCYDNTGLNDNAYYNDYKGIAIEKNWDVIDTAPNS